MTNPEPFTAAIDALNQAKEAIEKLAAQRDHFAEVAQDAIRRAERAEGSEKW